MVADKGKKPKVGDRIDDGADQVDDQLVQVIEKLQEVQDELEKINEEASDKVLEIEQKYNEIRKPVYDKRNDIIKSVPGFWLTAFMSHPALSALLTEEDQKIFKHLTSLEVEDTKDVKSGYSITFNFSPNSYFEDTKLTKTITFLDEGTTKITATPIKWKDGMGLANGVTHEKNGKKRPHEEDSFFSWFSGTQRKDDIDEIQDGVADITSDEFSGVIRIALLPNADSELEPVLDRFSSCYPVAGHALFREPFSVQYRWKTRGSGDLLMLANPLHLRLLEKDDSIKVLDDFKYRSIDGELVGVVGSLWVLKTDPVPVNWYSIKGVEKESYPEIIDALVQDVKGLDSSNITTNSSYFYGKLVARAARMALIAEEVDHVDVIPKVKQYLKDTIEPWLDGTFAGNRFLYDKSWGGLITLQGSNDRTGDFGFGIYNDHHFHIGYYLYGIAVLAKIDPVWGQKYRPQAYSLMLDFMTLRKGPDLMYTRLRSFDLWKLHSWAAGLTEFEDGRNQESTSEAVNAYYSAALMGLAYEDPHLVAIGSLLTAMEIHAAQTWWHVKEDNTLYDAEFTKANRVVGVLWQNKRDSGLWFAPAEQRAFRLGIQVLPLLPITETLFSDLEYAKQLVEWTLPSLNREGVTDGWKGFLYALEGLYEKEIALKNIRNLTGHDDGNSLSNMLWWIFSR